MNVSRPGRRIALFTGNYVNIVDGVSLTLNRLVAHLNTQGHEVVVFGPEGPERALAPTGEFVGLPSISAIMQPEYRFALRMPRAARSRLRSLKPELIHIATPDRIGHWAIDYGRKHGLPVVTSFHSNIVSYLEYIPVLRHFQSAGWWYFRRFYRRCDHIYVPTASMADELRAHGIDKGLRLWPRGVDTQRFSPEHRDLAWRRTLGIGDDEALVLFVARLRWEKNLKVLAQTISSLEQQKIPHRSVIVGDGIARQSLQDMLPNSIFCGRLEGPELSRAYASADLFLYPSATETFGNVILEAMASGLACVGADAPGSRSVALEGQTALLAPPTEVPRFVQHCKTLLSDDELRQGFARKAREHACTLSWPAAMQRMEEYYEQALGAPASPPH